MNIQWVNHTSFLPKKWYFYANQKAPGLWIKQTSAGGFEIGVHDAKRKEILWFYTTAMDLQINASFLNETPLIGYSMEYSML